MGVAFVGDHVLKSDQEDFIAELVLSREDFVRLLDAVVDDVVGAAGLKDLVDGGLFRGEVGHLLQGTRR